MPEVLMEFVELVVDGTSRIVEQKRLPGENDVGMIAWRMTLYTPEYPEGICLYFINCIELLKSSW